MSKMGWLLGLGLLCLALAALRRPAARLVGWIARSSVGLAVLALLAPVGPLVGVRLGVNLVNAGVLGLLGPPGLGLLLMLQWALH